MPAAIGSGRGQRGRTAGLLADSYPAQHVVEHPGDHEPDVEGGVGALVRVRDRADDDRRVYEWDHDPERHAECDDRGPAVAELGEPERAAQRSSQNGT